MSGATSPSSAPQSPTVTANFTEFERERRKLKRALQQALSDKDAADRWAGCTAAACWPPRPAPPLRALCALETTRCCSRVRSTTNGCGASSRRDASPRSAGRMCLCAARGANRSRPFPRCGGGRERSMSRGAGAPPATAHWAAAGPPTKVRSSPWASNSAPFCLFLTICLPLLPSLWPSDRPAGVSSRAHRPLRASTAAPPTPRPQA